MRKAHRCGVLFHILSASTGRTEYIHLNIARLNINFCLIHRHLWKDLHQGKGGMPAMRGIEWREADKTMNAFLRAEITECVFTFDSNCYAFDTRLFAFGNIENV